ncbi:MAG: SGNH/GDSL hydrolase family protein [Desulfomonilia bacterium]
MDGRIAIDGKGQIIAVGDSLTAGSQPSITEHAPFESLDPRLLLKTSYPYMLGEILIPSGGGDLVLNVGRSGSTTLDWTQGRSWQKKGVRDFPLNGYPLDEILEFHGNIRICLMMIGTNDVNYSVAPDRISRLMGGVVGYEDTEFIISRENIISTLIKLSERGIVSYLAKIPPNRYPGGLQFLGFDRLVFSRRTAQEKLERYTAMINERIEELLNSYPALVRRGPDFHALFEDNDRVWLKDRLHLNTLGYREMAKAWASLLDRDGIIVRLPA